MGESYILSGLDKGLIGRGVGGDARENLVNAGWEAPEPRVPSLGLGLTPPAPPACLALQSI